MEEEPAEPAEPTEPTASAQSVGPTEPAKPPEPDESAKPVGAAETTEPVEPAESTKGEGGSEGSGAPWKLCFIITMVALVALAGIAIAMPAIMNRLDGSTNRQMNANSSWTY